MIIEVNCDILVGVRFQGVSLPAIHVMLSKWAPPAERNRISSLAYAGNYPNRSLNIILFENIWCLGLRSWPLKKIIGIIRVWISLGLNLITFHEISFDSGMAVGTVIALPFSGILAQSLGWEWIFYFFGIIGCIWCFAWIWICFDSPAKHPRISQAWICFIETK